MPSLPPLPDHFGNPSLRDLTEIVPTADINFWPQTPAWGVLALLFSLWLLARLGKRYQRWLRNRYRREALAALNALSQRENPPDAASVNEILKLAALAHEERQHIAALSGAAWLDWLHAQVAQPVFSASSAQALCEGVYAPGRVLNTKDSARLVHEARCWIVQHHDNHATQ